MLAWLCLTFPYRDDSPTHRTKFAIHPTISLGVLLKLVQPEICPCRGDDLPLFAAVPVPEAAMNKDNYAVFRENDVRGSWEITLMKSKTVAHSV